MKKDLKLSWLLEFLEPFEQKYIEQHEQRPKGGKPKVYSHRSFLLFFINMFLFRIFHFKAMKKYAERHFEKFDFPRCPSRKTIRRRFKETAKFCVTIMPDIAIYCFKKYNQHSRNLFNIKHLFADKSVFRSKGGLWHRKHMKEGIIPHPSIDTDATWATSPYHKWRFGYGLLVLTNQQRFPVACYADTAKFNEPQAACKLILPLKDYLGILVGDKAYRVWKYIQHLWDDFDILLHTLWKDAIAKTKFQKMYKRLINTGQALCLYSKRKPSVEPCFSLIKELFDLKGETQLPYKGLTYASAFLVLTASCLQLLMIFNFCHQHKFREFEHFINLFR